MLTHLRYKILLVVGLSVAVVMAALAYYWTLRQESSILGQNARTVQRLTESVISGMESMMLPGYAHIAQGYADRLKDIPDLVDFRILRVDGTEAFMDNATIRAVNRRRGEEQFVRRDSEKVVPVIAPDAAALREALGHAGAALASYREQRGGIPVITFLDAIANRPGCYKCHGREQPVRGLVMLSMSLAPVHDEVIKTRKQIIAGAGLAIIAVLLLTGYTMGAAVLRPIELVTSAMQRAASGDLDHRVPIVSRDEVGRMAKSFNLMTVELKRSYQGLKLEQDKLATIIHSAGEGIVVTDGQGDIVLVNPSAERLLGRDSRQIAQGGFLALLGDPALMRERLARGVVSNPQPLLHNGQMLAVCAATLRADTGEDIGSAALIRDVTEQMRLEEELRRQSVTDGLTGLFNRRHLDATLAAELTRARRYGAPLSLAMLDVDHFKRFNDTHGHEMGDRVLRAVAATMKTALRAQDIPCRYGGEEFVAILPNTGCEGATIVAERLRRDVEAMTLAGLNVTISIGIAGFPQFDAANAEALVEAADAALYEAKSAGRNCVRTHKASA